MDSILFETVERVDVSELMEFYARQGRHLRTAPEKLSRMMEESFCLVTARANGRLIGFARGTTDGVRGQLVECKLDPDYQGPAAVTRKDGRIEHDREGIAKEMATRVVEALRRYGVEDVHTLAYGTEVDFCEELGFKKVGGMVALRLELPEAASAAVSSGSRDASRVS